MSVARVCIVGAGPSGMYTAKYLLKSLSSFIMLDIYESLPTPFGLVRSGVAPDHPHTKSVINEFNAILQDQRVRFIGNCKVENVAQVVQDYSAVVVCTGANDDKSLGIEGEFVDGVYSARKFVNWYNGYPSKDFKVIDKEFKEKLRTSQAAVVIGHGNVAVDIARILLQPKTRLENTDICTSALEALENSAVSKVYLVGRRGPVQAAFTTKELREVTKVEGIRSYMLQRDFDDGMNPSSEIELKDRVYKRKVDVLQSILAPNEDSNSSTKELIFRFLLNPKRIVEKDGRVAGIEFSRNKLRGDAFNQVSVIDASQAKEIINAQLIFKSIGYRSEGIKGIPFDSRKSIIPSRQGRIVDQENQSILPGFYTSGWIKRGPSGIIGTNIPDAQETVHSIVEDWNSGLLKKFDSSIFKPSILYNHKDIIDFNGWNRIDQEEIRLGSLSGKPREKFIDIADMLEIAKRS